MTKEAIIKKFEKKGYRLARAIATNNVIVRKENLLSGKVFSSYNAAYKYFFKN